MLTIIFTLPFGRVNFFMVVVVVRFFDMLTNKQREGNWNRSYLTYSLFDIKKGSHLGSASAVQFFSYDTPKVIMLLTLTVKVIGILMVNELALVLLYGLLGWKVAASTL